MGISVFEPHFQGGEVLSFLIDFYEKCHRQAFLSMITAFYTRNVVEKRLDVVFHMKSLNFSYIVLVFQSKPVPNILDLFLLGEAVAPPVP